MGNVNLGRGRRTLAWRLATLTLLVAGLNPVMAAGTFQGRITATLTRGGDTNSLLYTIGANSLRIEQTGTDGPHAINIVNRDSGEVLLLFSNNRSFLRLKPAANGASTPPGFPVMPTMSPGSGWQTCNPPSTPVGIGPAKFPGMPAPPNANGFPPGFGLPGANHAAVLPTPRGGGFPTMSIMRKMELNATGEKTNLLGFACEKYEIKQPGETMEIWATGKLLPFHLYLENQPHRFRPRRIEEQWNGLLRAKNLFPLLAVLKFENGAEWLRFQVKTVTSQKIEDQDGRLFQRPAGYREIELLPF